jgi:hypothetical protein
MLSSRQANAPFYPAMRAKKIAKVSLVILAILIVAGCVAWQVIGYGLKAFAKGGVC